VPTHNPIQFLRESGTPVDVISQSALSTNSYNLAQYKTIVLYGHDEYWTKGELTQISSAVKNGTSLLNISGNTGFRRVIYTDGVLSFEQNAKGDDLSELPQSIGNPVIQMLGVRYLFYPFKRGVENSALPFSPAQYDQLKTQGLPNDIAFDAALAHTSGLWIPNTSSPLFDGVETDAQGFVGVASSVQNVEVDGVLLTDAGVLTLGNRKMLGLEDADVLAQSWANYPPAKGPALSSRMGALIAKYYFKGRVISAGSIGWVRALVESRDPAVAKITQNALKLLNSDAKATKSRVTWTRTPKVAGKWVNVAKIVAGANEQVGVAAPCAQPGAKISCGLKVTNGQIYLKLKTVKQKAIVNVRVTGAANFRVVFKPHEVAYTY